MKLEIITILLLLNTIVFGQETNQERIEKLKKEVIQIENEIQIKQESLNELKKELKHLEIQEYLSNFQENGDGSSINATLRMDGKLRKSSGPASEIILIISKNDTVKLTDYKDYYWIINKGQYFGYLSEMYIKETEEVIIFKVLN